MVFYNKESGKKLAECLLEKMYPDDFQIFHHKNKILTALSVFKQSAGNKAKLTTSLMVYEGRK